VWPTQHRGEAEGEGCRQAMGLWAHGTAPKTIGSSSKARRPTAAGRQPSALSSLNTSCGPIPRHRRRSDSWCSLVPNPTDFIESSVRLSGSVIARVSYETEVSQAKGEWVVPCLESSVRILYVDFVYTTASTRVGS
jgi:hypothetical protein